MIIFFRGKIEKLDYLAFTYYILSLMLPKIHPNPSSPSNKKKWTLTGNFFLDRYTHQKKIDLLN